MPHFVILEHDHPTLHWDFMLECGEVLRTWRLAAPPQAEGAVAAEASFDHRLHYLDYEGPVSSNRGTVRRWDAGQFLEESRADNHVVVRLQGSRLRGTVKLQRNPAGAWTCRFVP